MAFLPEESTKPGKLELKDRMNPTHQPKLTLNKTTVRYPTVDDINPALPIVRNIP